VDRDLQSYVRARLGNESASVVVMDVTNGDLLAIASAPSYDPNKFVRGITVDDYAKLRDNERRPLASKTVQDAYPPGSTFKMVTALAALEAGVVSPEETVWCPGHMEVGGRRFHCWKRVGHGHMNLEEALKESCDVYFYDLALEVGIDNIAAMARKLGLGQAYDIPMSAVAEGLVPDRDWKARTRDAQWRIGDTVNASIGQGYVLSSPLQLAVMTARLATGRTMAPRLLKSVEGVDQPAPAHEPLGFNENNLRRIRAAMYAATNDRRGTAYGSRIIAEAMRMAGKTGTSQVRNITAAERRAGVTRNEDLPWNRRDHALFVNFAPYEAPRIAVAVVVEHGGGGSTAAAPIARDVTLQALYGGDPPLEAYPAADRSRIEAQQERLAREREQREAEDQSRA
jgi:penicillin-binding protein 2